MSQLDEWEEEKIRRLQGSGTGKEETAVPAEADEPPPKGSDGPGSGGDEGNSCPSFEEIPPAENLKETFTLKLSSIIAFQISALVVAPLCLGMIGWLFQGETARWASVLVAFLALHPIRSALERSSWPGDRSINVITTAIVLVGGGFVAVVLFIFVWGLTGIVTTQREAAKAVERRNIISEKQLPLAGYEHEKETAKYLQMVAQLRASIDPPVREDRQRWYADYRRIYVEPLTEMGYEFDVTLSKALDRYMVRQLHRRTGDDLELLVFNGVCFREDLFRDGLISSDTGVRLAQVGIEWGKEQSGGAEIPYGKPTVFESRCPITDVALFFHR